MVFYSPNPFPTARPFICHGHDDTQQRWCNPRSPTPLTAKKGDIRQPGFRQMMFSETPAYERGPRVRDPALSRNRLHLEGAGWCGLPLFNRAAQREIGFLTLL